jgi:hypothetical protein
MSNNNLKLWDFVSVTETKYTKKAKKGAHNFTSITPMSQFKKATEAFGIQGIHWGIKIGSEVFTEQAIGTTNLLNYDAILYFTYGGERGEIPVHATEKLSYQTQGANGYLKIDDEVRKKVVTNAKTKGLSELGFNADIFMGQFDDPNYVEYIRYEQQINDSENKQDEIKIKTDELNDWCKKSVGLYSTIPNKRALDLILVQHKNKLQGRCNLLGLDFKAYSKAFDNEYNKQLETLNTKTTGEK